MILTISLAALSRDTSGDRLALAAGKHSLHGSRDIGGSGGRPESRMSGASAGDWGLPDLEVDHNIAVTRDESGDRGVTRTTSLLVTGVDMDKPLDSAVADMDVLAKRDEVLKDLEEKKNQIKEAKGDSTTIFNPTHFHLTINHLLFHCSLDSKRSYDCSWCWCDGISTNFGVYGNLGIDLFLL